MAEAPSPTTSPSSPIFRHLDLLWQFTVRAIEQRHRGSYLGIAWSVLNPLLMLAVYVTVFGVIFGGSFHTDVKETPLDYAMAVFLGLILFHVLSETLAASPTFIVGQPNFVKKVVFPLHILPLSNLGAYWFHFFISLGLLILGGLLIGHTFTLYGLMWLPAILIPHMLLTIGLAWGLSALGVFFRDIMQLTNFLAIVSLYASAVFFRANAETVSPAIWAVIKWNPFLHTVAQARDTLLWNKPIDLLALGYTWACGLVAITVGWFLFRKMQPAFADVI